jgi:ABC-type phosphate transport system substrate-binding protein
MTIITKGMGAILKAAKKSWKDKRIDAMNRQIKKRGRPGTTEHYSDEYSAVSESKAPSKKIYKSVQRKWHSLDAAQKDKIWMKRAQRTPGNINFKKKK